MFYLGDSIEGNKASTVQMVFWAYAGLIGLSLAFIFIEYTGTSIAQVFFISAGTFGAMNIYGYTTKKDLSGWLNTPITIDPCA